MASSRPGSHTNFSKYFKRQFAPLKDSLSSTTLEIREVLDDSLTSGKTSAKYWKSIDVELNKLYKDLGNDFTDWSQEEIPKVYDREIYYWQKRVNDTKKNDATAKVSATALLLSRPSKTAKATLTASAINDYRSALIVGRRDMMRLTRMTQQALVSESFINDAVLRNVENIKKAVSEISDELYRKVLNQKNHNRFVHAGSKTYTPEYYAELVSRTKFHDAQFLATKAQAANMDTDLVRVSAHNTTTEICQQYEGKVFSLSGKDSRFPVLDQGTPFHPNCLHVTLLEFESGMIADGTLKGFEEFSNGVVSTPPTPASFIPVTKRGVA